MKAYKVVAVCLLIFSPMCFAQLSDKEKIKRAFYTMAVTRSWEYALRNINNVKPESKPEAVLSTVTFAFRYWVLLQHGILDREPAFEAQIKRAFAAGVLPPSRLDDPLGRFETDLPTMGLSGVILDEEEYRDFSKRFKDFALGK